MNEPPRKTGSSLFAGKTGKNIIIQGIFADQTYEEAVKDLGFSYLTKNRGRME